METVRASAAPILSSRRQRLAILPSKQRQEKMLARALPDVDPVAVGYIARLPNMNQASAIRSMQPYHYDELQEDILPRYDHLKDLDAAAERLADAITKGEIIGISGDYDCDGNCSTALMVRFLQESRVNPANIHVHIPNREREGYGVNRNAVEDMACKNPPVQLLITLDNGTLAHKPLSRAKELGMQTIVIDHHPNSEGHALPPGLVVNPRRYDEPLSDDTDGVGDLAAVGVTWLICRRATQKLAERGYYEGHTKPDPRNWLGLVALATQADVVDISKPLNRSLLKEGLNVINEGADPYISSLARVAQVNDPEKLSETDISFNLGPIVNAPGRLGQSVAWAFLTAPDATSELLDRFMESANTQTKELHDALQQQRASLSQQRFAEPSAEQDRAMNSALRFGPLQAEKAIAIARESEPTIDPRQHALMLLSRESNNLRKLIEGAVTREARPQARRLLEQNPNTSVLVLHGKGWHEGVVGIVAGRIKEEFNLPTLVASVLPPNERGEILCKASARSIKVDGHPVDIGQAIRDMSPEDGVDNPNLLMKKGGGHAMAAGCSFAYTNLDAIRAHLNTALKEPLIEAKKAQRAWLAGAIDMQGDAKETLQHWTQAQNTLRPFGEGSRAPLVGLYGCDITPPRIMGRSGKHLEFQILSGEHIITAHAFHAVGTDLEKTLREAARQPKGLMHMLVGTLEAPPKGADRSKEPMPVFQLQDMMALPIAKTQTGSDALAYALGVRRQDLIGVMAQTSTSKGI